MAAGAGGEGRVSEAGTGPVSDGPGSGAQLMPAKMDLDVRQRGPLPTPLPFPWGLSVRCSTPSPVISRSGDLAPTWRSPPLPLSSPPALLPTAPDQPRRIRPFESPASPNEPRPHTVYSQQSKLRESRPFGLCWIQGDGKAVTVPRAKTEV